MANTIEYAQKFVPIIDGIYKKASLTAALDAATKLDFSGTNTVNVMKVETSGLGDYSRDTGYPVGDASVIWEPMKLTEERGKEINIDRMDDEETLGQAFGMVMNEFMRLHVAPELDAYRFAKYASAEGITTKAEALATGEAVLGAIDAASAVMDGEEAPDNRILFVSSALKPVLAAGVARQWGSEGGISRVLTSYNDMPIVYVPQKRFFSGITLNSGADAWGFTNAGKALNFLMVCPESVLQVKKMALPKIFDPDTNQDKDAWKFQYRLYHDALVYANKANGIYAHTAV